MAKSPSDFGFMACADLIFEQHYARALKHFQLAVTRFLESKSTPKRTEIARQLLHIGTALEETLKKAFGDTWEQQIPQFVDKEVELSCSFCGKGEHEVPRLIAGIGVQVCNECVELCSGIIAAESEQKPDVSLHEQERLCGVCMEARDPDELIFLPHAAYLCPGCLEELQVVRERHNDK